MLKEELDAAFGKMFKFNVTRLTNYFLTVLDGFWIKTFISGVWVAHLSMINFFHSYVVDQLTRWLISLHAKTWRRLKAKNLFPIHDSKNMTFKESKCEHIFGIISKTSYN